MAEQVGPYRVEREIGRGGMGVVYLARDDRLDRNVAIKALPEELASDAARLERFEREARTLAALNHPNIAGIYGVEEQGGQKYLILEYVEGETLGERLDRGAIPVDEAIEIALEIARGVEAAHEAGVVHRDLKPDNVKITPDGRVKVLDFGLAKAEEGVGSSTGDSPTVVARHSPTIPGAILGTAAYMSPEQARGRHVDKRTDVWSFGVILYEMLTGASPFAGETATDSIGAVLHKGIDLERLPRATGPAVRRAIARCLERDRRLRYRDIGDVAIELAHASDEPPANAAPARTGLVPVLLAVAIVVGLIGGGVGWFAASSSRRPGNGAVRDGPGPPRPLIVDLAAPDGYVIARRHGPPRLSPDGDRLAIIVRERPESPGDEVGPGLLCVKDLVTGETTIYDQLEDVVYPTWSPDGRYLMHARADAAIYRLDMATGHSETAFAGGGTYPRGAESMPDGTLAAAVSRTGLARWDIGTGEPLDELPIVTADESGGGFPTWPTALPDGRHYLYTYTGDNTVDGVYLAEIGSDEQVRLTTEGSTQTRYLPAEGGGPGFLYFTRGAAIFRQALDLEAAALVGDPELVADGAWVGQWPYFTPFDVGPGGRLVYFDAPVVAFENELVRRDVATGTETSTGLTGSLWNPTYSSDDRYVLLDITTDATFGDVYSIDLERDYLATVISDDPVNETFPTWVGDDNTSIVYFHDGDLYLADHDGTRRPGPIVESPESLMPISATPSGDTIIYIDSFRSRTPELKLYDTTSGESRPWLDFDVSDMRVAPNGRWAVVTTGRPSRRQLELRRFPEGTDRAILDTGGVLGAEWTQDGSQIFYGKDGRLVRVEVAWPGGSPDEGGPGRPTFGAPIDVMSFRGYREFDVNSDGSELILIKSIEQTSGDSIRLVQADPPTPR